MSRVEENDQMLESVKKNLDNIREARDEYDVNLGMKFNIAIWANVIGLLGDISRSLAVIADVMGKEHDEHDETE